MAEFYCWPHWMLTALVMVLALAILLQTLVVSYSFRRLPTGWVRGAESGMECTILAALLCFAALLARVQYGLFCGFLSPSDYGAVRQVVFLMTAVLGTAAAVGAEDMLLPALGVIVLALVLLRPRLERGRELATPEREREVLP